VRAENATLVWRVWRAFRGAFLSRISMDFHCFWSCVASSYRLIINNLKKKLRLKFAFFSLTWGSRGRKFKSSRSDTRKRKIV